MTKIAVIATFLSLFLAGGVVIAEETQEEKPGVIHHINTGPDDSGDDNMKPEDYEGQELPSYQSYDPNTGMTDNTQSDAVGNLN